VSENAGMPLARKGLVDDVKTLVDLPTEAGAPSACVVCGSPSTTQATDPRPVLSPGNDIGPIPPTLPVLQLCDEHWSAYRTDWLLLGWCVDHYAEALRYCEQHEQHVPPL